MIKNFIQMHTTYSFVPSLFLDKGILKNIPASISKRYIQPIMQTLRDKQEAIQATNPIAKLPPVRAKMFIAVTFKARYASAIKSLSSFCKIAHVPVR